MVGFWQEERWAEVPWLIGDGRECGSSPHLQGSRTQCQSPPSKGGGSTLELSVAYRAAQVPHLGDVLTWRRKRKS